jgi:hypothetical protein
MRFEKSAYTRPALSMAGVGSPLLAVSSGPHPQLRAVQRAVLPQLSNAVRKINRIVERIDDRRAAAGRRRAAIPAVIGKSARPLGGVTAVV